MMTPLAFAAARGTFAGNSTAEIGVLAAHLLSCNESRGPLFMLRALRDPLAQLIASRVITTLALAAVLGIAARVIL